MFLGYTNQKSIQAIVENMKRLTLYIDKWYIIGAVCTDGIPHLICPSNKEDRFWLYFYEDVINDEVVYGKENQSHYRNNE